jgi:predicted PurR-regulated permease PerM
MWRSNWSGASAGLRSWILGLPALLPVVGTSLIPRPAAALALIYQGIWIKAIILIAWGDLVASLVDNVLYPLLVLPNCGSTSSMSSLQPSGA